MLHEARMPFYVAAATAAVSGTRYDSRPKSTQSCRGWWVGKRELLFLTGSLNIVGDLKWAFSVELIEIAIKNRVILTRIA